MTQSETAPATADKAPPEPRRLRFLDYKARQKEAVLAKLGWLRLLLFVATFVTGYQVETAGLAPWGYGYVIAVWLVFLGSVYIYNRVDRRLFLTKTRRVVAGQSAARLDPDWAQSNNILPPYLAGRDDIGYDDDLGLSGRFSFLARFDNTATDLGAGKLTGRLNEPVGETLLKGSDEDFWQDLTARRELIRELSRARSLTLGLQAKSFTISAKVEDYRRLELKPALEFLEPDPEDNSGLFTFAFWVRFTGFISLALFYVGLVLPIFGYGTAVAAYGFVGILIHLVSIIAVSRLGNFAEIRYWQSVLPSLMFWQSAILKRKWQSPLGKKLVERMQSAQEPLLVWLRIQNQMSVRQTAALWFVLNLFFLWDIFIWYRLLVWLKTHRDTLKEWLNDIAVWDELVSWSVAVHDFAGELNDVTNNPGTLSGVDLRHPLLHKDAVVGNDCALNQKQAVMLLTGSNMSGKSTYLRSIGLNYLLAYCTGLVFAGDFNFERRRLACSVKIQDSLEEGISLFYQEVLKIKQILAMLDEGQPALVLIDEMLRGTNSLERTIASKAIVNKLASTKPPVFAVIATHDLDLVRPYHSGEDNKIAGLPIQYNYFQELVTDGEMHFDYKLHSGVLQKTNAIRVLESAGIDLDFEKFNPRGQGK